MRFKAFFPFSLILLEEELPGAVLFEEHRLPRLENRLTNLLDRGVDGGHASIFIVNFLLDRAEAELKLCKGRERPRNEATSERWLVMWVGRGAKRARSEKAS